MRYDSRHQSSTGPSLIERLARAEPVYSLGVRFSLTADIARIASMAAYDLIWVDLEHSCMSMDAAGEILSCAHDLGLGAWARVPENDFGSIGRLLDSGATGVIMPKVETAEQARRLAACCRFPPEGERSMIARLPQSGFAKTPNTDLIEAANRMTVCQALIESRVGVSNADAIAAVEGIDILAIGMNDLTADFGCPGDARNAEIMSACQAVANAAKRYNKIAVVGGVANEQHFADMLKMGFAPLVFAGIDTDIMADGVVSRRARWREALPRGGE